MTASIHTELTLPGLPSASAVELVGPTAYIVSDDAPYLYLLDADTLAATGQVQLFATSEFGRGRIPKKAKPDLENLVALPWPAGQVGLLLGGSGSRPNREVGYFVALPPGPAAPADALPPVQALDLSGLFAQLREHLPAGTKLNIEASAATATELLLLQRGVAGGAALLFGLPLAATLAHLLAGQGPAPAPARVLRFQLPLLDGLPAGFSGATCAHGTLFVTASVENTTDAVLDGAVLGSFVGIVDLASQTATFARLAWADGRAYRGKVEGLAMRRLLAPGHAELLLVTDDDLGGSTALLAEVHWKN